MTFREAIVSSAALLSLTLMPMSLMAAGDTHLEAGQSSQAEAGAGSISAEHHGGVSGDISGGETDATRKVQEITEDTKVDEHGLVQPSSGGAEPVENWFGCKNSSDEQEASCDEQDADGSAHPGVSPKDGES